MMLRQVLCCAYSFFSNRLHTAITAPNTTPAIGQTIQQRFHAFWVKPHAKKTAVAESQ